MCVCSEAALLSAQHNTIKTMPCCDLDCLNNPTWHGMHVHVCPGHRRAASLERPLTVGKSMMLICCGEGSDTVAVLQVRTCMLYVPVVYSYSYSSYSRQEYVIRPNVFPKQTILHESMQTKHLQGLSEVWVTWDYEAVGNRNEAMRQGCSKKVPRAGTTHALGAHRLHDALNCL